MNKKEIEKIFSVTNESKKNKQEKMEKNNRRFETLVTIPEIKEKIHTEKKCVINILIELNKKYANELDNTQVINSIEEIRALKNLLITNEKDTHNNLVAKAIVLVYLELYYYTDLLKKCNLIKGCKLKTLCRLKNMKEISNSFLNKKITKEIYIKDLRNQQLFFSYLLDKYEKVSKDNYYAYLVRYDVATKRKRKEIHSDNFVNKLFNRFFNKKKNK